ncbi:MAG: AMP-binding protein [Dissulfurimicrobium sp.]|uniref:AMP-binding protein n=1 Tax=Dissulfurimicrobium sp. TaxID=2022436 RepID=UPI00404A3713
MKRLHRVGLICDDGIDYIVTSLAVLSLNAVIVPIAPKQTMTEIEHVIDRIDMDFLISEQGKYQTEDTFNLNSDGLYKKPFYLCKSGKKTGGGNGAEPAPMVKESLLRISPPQYGPIPVARVVLKKDALNAMITDDL